MGNKVIQKSSFNIIDIDELKEFLSSLNVLDVYSSDTNLSISSKCLVIINNLINHLTLSSNMGDDLSNYKSCHIFNDISIPFDRESSDKIDRFKANCQLIRRLSIFNSNFHTVEEFIELNNFIHLLSLQLENVPIKFVQHLKSHRDTLLKLCVHYCISDLGSLIELCGGDHSFSGDWKELLHLDVRYNNLRSIDKSVLLLRKLSVLDVSRNNLQSISFLEKIPTLTCLNASYNNIDSLPSIPNHSLRVLIIGYNYIDSLKEIRNLKQLLTLNASYNMISSISCLNQLYELDYLKDLILIGNPISTSNTYRNAVLGVLSTRINVNFALDGREFSKKDKIYLQKVPTIAIQRPSNSSSNFRSHVPIIKPNRKMDIANASSPDNAPGSYLRSRNIFAKINEGDNPDDYEDISGYISPSNQNRPVVIIKKPTLIPIENMIESLADTDCDGTVTTIEGLPSSVITPSKAHPFYLGKKTSNLICVSKNSMSSFNKVSLQIIEHKFMAIDEVDEIVDHLDLWTLLVAYLDLEYNCILRLSFYDESCSQGSKNISLFNRSLEFSNPDELRIFKENLDLYLYEFKISRDNVSSMATTVIMLCCICLANYEFNSKSYRPIICKNCKGTGFKFENAIDARRFTMKNGMASPNIVQSPNKPKMYLKPETSEIVRKAFSAENISNQNVSSVSNDTSFCTALDQNDQNIRSEGDSIYDSQDPIYEDDKVESTDKDDILNIGIKIENYESTFFLENSANMKISDEDSTSIYLNKKCKSEWVAYQPLSDVSIHMDNITKIDDRVKLYFLTKVMYDREDMHAVFKSNLAYKTVSSVTIETFVVLSNSRILFYSWVDKDSPSFEVCLKLIVEFRLKHILQINDCLNHQWIDIHFKKKGQVSLFIGDIRATKNILQTILDLASSCLSTLCVKTLKKIDEFDSHQILVDMAKAMNDEGIDVRDSCEYYLIKSCNEHAQENAPSSEYAPKMIGIHPEYLFFFNIKLQTKPHQLSFELFSTLSFYDLRNNIIIDSTNDYRCQLKTDGKSADKLIDIEFLSPATRSQVILRITKLWKDLFQTNIICDFFCD